MARLIVCLASALLLALNSAHATTLEDADQLLASGHLVRADRAIAQVLAAQPDSARAHYLDARLLAAEGKWPLAEDELQRARRLDPKLDFAPEAQVRALSDSVIRHRWKSPAGLAGYAQAALAVLFVLVSGSLIVGVLRSRGRPPKT